MAVGGIFSIVAFYIGLYVHAHLVNVGVCLRISAVKVRRCVAYCARGATKITAGGYQGLTCNFLLIHS